MSDVEDELRALQLKQQQELEEMRRKVAEKKRAEEKKKAEAEERRKAEEEKKQREEEKKRKAAEARKQKAVEAKKAGGSGTKRTRVEEEESGKCDRCDRLGLECVRVKGRACKGCAEKQRACEWNGVGVRAGKKMKKGTGKEKEVVEEDEEEDGDGGLLGQGAGSEDEVVDAQDAFFRSMPAALGFLAGQAKFW
jgi:colicin import membrane protein